MNDPFAQPFDAGLQTERTALSWQRTALASVVGFLLAARLLLDLIGVSSIVFAGAGLVITVVLFLVGHQRYRRAHTILVTSGDRAGLTSAVPLLVWAIIVILLGMLALGFAIAVNVAR